MKVTVSIQEFSYNHGEPFKSCFFSYSGASIHAEDQTLCTPVLTAATHNKIEAFHCLMQFMDLKDYPILKALHLKSHQAETLTVSLHSHVCRSR